MRTQPRTWKSKTFHVPKYPEPKDPVIGTIFGQRSDKEHFYLTVLALEDLEKSWEVFDTYLNCSCRLGHTCKSKLHRGLNAPDS